MQLRAKVKELWVTNADGEVKPRKKITAVAGKGIRGDSHYGDRISDVREHGLFNITKGTDVFNWRQIAATAYNEHAAIAAKANIPLECITGRELFSNIVFDDVPAFSELPPWTMVKFSNEGSPVLIVTLENNPCIIIGETIAAAAGRQDLAPKIVKSAMYLRGVMMIVLKSGFIKLDTDAMFSLPEDFLRNAR